MLREAGRRIRREHLPPRLRWEAPVWDWFKRLAVGEPLHADRAALQRVIEREGWDEALVLDLILIIEGGLMEIRAQQLEKLTP